MMASHWQPTIAGVPEVPTRAALGVGGGDRGSSHANVAVTIVLGASAPGEAEAEQSISVFSM